MATTIRDGVVIEGFLSERGIQAALRIAQRKQRQRVGANVSEGTPDRECRVRGARGALLATLPAWAWL